jgi:2-polyprenyl-3-methyl-5-hydroxy-6-metoxy-1,4-benzoquinol methylase
MGHVVFDQTANSFARGIDAAIASGTYTRGRLFLEAVERTVRPGGRILDYGCGPGRIARLIAQRGYRVEGRDPSEPMIAEASTQRTDGLRLSFAVDRGDPLETGAYDGIVCSSVIEFVPNAHRLLVDFRRALGPSGTLVMSYSNRSSLWRTYATMRYRSRLRHLAASHHVWTLGQTERALDAADLELASSPVFFESVFDTRPRLRFLSGSRFVGILGLVTARARPPHVSSSHQRTDGNQGTHSSRHIT